MRKNAYRHKSINASQSNSSYVSIMTVQKIHVWHGNAFSCIYYVFSLVINRNAFLKSFLTIANIFARESLKLICYVSHFWPTSHCKLDLAMVTEATQVSNHRN